MSKLMTLEDAIELENHFIEASKALKCAHRKMKGINGFKSTCREVSTAILDTDISASLIRQWITDNT